MNDPLSILPDEIILNFASYLPSALDLTRLEQTYHRWRRILRRDDASGETTSIWKKLCAHKWKKYPRYSMLVLDEAEWTRNHPQWIPDGTPPRLQGGVVFDDDSSGDDVGDNDQPGHETSFSTGIFS